MNTLKDFCLLELETDANSPMIGVINEIGNNPIGFDSFRKRAIQAIEKHFDAEAVSLGDDFHSLENIFSGAPYEDIKVKTVGIDTPYCVHTIRILETWIY